MSATLILSMKNKFLSSFRCPLAALRLLFGCVLLLGASASAQNLLVNGDFESPLTPWNPARGVSSVTNNWTLAYPSGGPGDFSIHDRTTFASRNCPSGGVDCGYGVHLRPKTDWWCHAYFTQTVTNLNPSANYYVTGYMNRFYGVSALDIYVEVVGATDNSVHTPKSNQTGWVQYFVSNNIPTVSGTLEVRLQLNKSATAWSPSAGAEKYWNTDAMFDDFTLAPQ